MGEFQTMALAWVKDAHRQAEAKAATRQEALQMARDFGVTWEEIAGALGMSRQTAHKRFGHLVRPPDPEIRDTVERFDEAFHEESDDVG